MNNNLTIRSFNTEGDLLTFKKKGNQYHVSNISIGSYKELFENEILDPSPRYQRPYTYKDTPNGDGSSWQRELIADIFEGSFIQPIHLRYRHDLEKQVILDTSSTYFVNEIIDGGHRTRTIISFIHDCIKLPPQFKIFADGEYIEIGGRSFSELEEKIQNKFLSLELTLVIHFGLSEEGAGKKFRTLNDLHSMSNQGKRNSEYRHIASIVRQVGASDVSQFKMFSELDNTGKPVYQAFNLKTDSRMSDELVAELVYILKQMKPGKIEDYQSPTKINLDLMYQQDTKESDDESKSIFNRDGDLYKRVNQALEFVNKLATDGTDYSYQNFTKKKITKSSIIKLVLFFDWILSNNPKVKIDKFDTKVFWEKFYDTIINHPYKHIEYQTYKIVDNKVVIDKKGDTTKHKTIGSNMGVFGTGKRMDDMMFILYQLMANFDIVEWGLSKVVKDSKREFTQEQKDEMWRIQKGLCRITNKSLKDIKYAADHIIPHSYGAPTDIINGQLICSDINRDKSSGVTKSDVKLVCDRLKYPKTNSMLDMIDNDRLTPDEIRMVVKKLWPNNN